MTAMILGIGSALAPNRLSQMDTLVLAKEISCSSSRQERLLEELYIKSGVTTRSTVLDAATTASENNFYQKPRTTCDTGPTTEERMLKYEREAAPLATSACSEALHHASVRSEQVTHIVTVSCTGFAAPGFDLRLFETLSLKPTVQRTHIGFMGCHGALNALRVAKALCAEDPSNVVLVCATELCSMHFQYGWSRERVVSNALFADGAAAVVLTGNSEFASNALMTIDRSASHVVPNTANAMTWKIGDAGFVMTLASEIPSLIENNLPLFVEEWLASNQLTVGDVASWAVHPGGPKILDSVAACLKLPENALDTSRQILAECGNMSSPTILFVLQRLIATAATKPCVALAFGPGLTIEAALFR